MHLAGYVAARNSNHAWPDHGRPDRSRPGVEPAEFRQLRHHTRNALQRLIAMLHLDPALAATAHGRLMVADLERRLCLSATISDQLFGFRSVPGRLEERLLVLGRAVAALHGLPGQAIAVEASVDRDCPVHLHETILRVAHEMLTNAVTHGMGARRTGAIRIRLPLEGNGSRARLQVIDDGAGPPEGWERAGDREGLGLMREIAAEMGGSVHLRREADRTVAECVLPTPVRRR